VPGSNTQMVAERPDGATSQQGDAPSGTTIRR
jgi:hypothetical protein